MFDVRLRQSFVDDLRLIQKTDQQAVVEAVETQLVHEPDRQRRDPGTQGNQRALHPRQAVRAMKSIKVVNPWADVSALLSQARQEDVIIRAEDGQEFVLAAIDDFDKEVMQTRRNEKLMALLDQCAQEPATMTLEEAKKALGLSGRLVVG
jgi:hypothetical protein